MKLKVKENFHMAAMLVYSFYKNIIWTEFAYEECNFLEYDTMLSSNF
jgi:hypothetical protein